MKLIDYAQEQGFSKSECRRLALQGELKLNQHEVELEDLDVELVTLDEISFANIDFIYIEMKP